MKVICGKHALVTGAASGIGRAIALALAREGANVYLLDIDDARLAQVVAEARACGTRATGMHCDLARPEEITTVLKACLRSWGHLDIVINNGGVSYHGKTEQMSTERWNWLLAINLLAPVQIVRELLPTLLAREEAHVLNVCSILGLVAIPQFTAYQVSKFGLVGLSESLRAEYSCRGLGVTALCPGFVRTNIFEASASGEGSRAMRLPPRWLFASPEAIAARAIRAIYHNQGLVPVTRLASFLWFVKRLSPRLWGLASRARKKKRKAMVSAAPDPLDYPREVSEPLEAGKP